MKINQLLFISLFIATVFAVSSCSNSPYPGFKKTENGVYAKFYHKSKDGKKPVETDVITVKMDYRLKDTLIFTSKDMPEALVFPMIAPTFSGDVYAGLALMSVDDSATFVFPADSFFLKTAGMPQLPEYVTAGSPMYFDIKLLKVQTQAEVEAERIAQLAEMKAQEMTNLHEYLTANGITIAPTESGLYFIETKKGSGRLPKVGEMLQVHFIVSVLGGNQLFSSYNQNPIDVEYGKQFDTKGFDEAIGYLSKGAKATVIVPSSMAFDSLGRSNMIPPYTTLVYELELLNIRSVEEVQKERAAKAKAEELARTQAKTNETAKIAKYLKDNNIAKEPLPSGLYYIETQQGTGSQAAVGKKVKVHYTLYNIAGKKLQSSIESNSPYEFVLGQKSVIDGWEEGLTYMKAGGKAMLIVPSSLAYGENQRGPDIPPYSPLVFEIEMLEVN